MKVLVIGGTAFVGRSIIDSALSAGHDVTLFHRGQTNPGLFPGTRELLGDRDGGLDALPDERWDAVIDTCGYVPRIVEQSVRRLSGKVDRYVFISTISVYDDLGADSIDEDGPLATFADPEVETIDAETYGGLKVLCEQVVNQTFGKAATVIRPGLIVGPWDRSDRFTYWVERMVRGGRALVPDRLDQPVQWIDVRDLGEWTVRLAANGISGTFNATGPADPTSLGSLLERTNHELGNRAELIPAPTSFLESQGVAAWTDLPLVDPYDGSADGMSRIDCSKAVRSGLTYRPLDETVRDTARWFGEGRPAGPLKAGLAPDRETAVLEALAEVMAAGTAG